MEAHLRKKGFLITLEGNEGSGKSTQIKLLQRYLKRKRIPVVVTHEPGGTVISAQIRKILLDRKNIRMNGECETLLYMAARAQLVEEVIKPAIRTGKVVLCDRWLDATMAYQGYGAGISLQWIRSMGQKVTAGVRPKRSLYLDLPLNLGLKRATSHKVADRMERKKMIFHKRVRRGYLSLAKQEPGRFRVISVQAKDSVQVVHSKILKVLKNVLG